MPVDNCSLLIHARACLRADALMQGSNKRDVYNNNNRRTASMMTEVSEVGDVAVLATGAVWETIQ